MTEEHKNVFVKPDEQSEACFDFAMARKGRMKSNIPLFHETKQFEELSSSIHKTFFGLFIPFGFGREYAILLVKLWQFALETMAVSGKKCLKRQ